MFLNRGLTTACYLVTQVSTARALAVWRLARSRYRLIGRSGETHRQATAFTHVHLRMNVSKRGFEVPNDSINDDRLILFSWPFDYHFHSSDMQDACPLIPAVVSHTHQIPYVLNFNRLNSNVNKNTFLNYWSLKQDPPNVSSYVPINTASHLNRLESSSKHTFTEIFRVHRLSCFIVPSSS
jgi:hypothetical protein